MSTEQDLFTLPQRYLDVQAAARELAADCSDIAARADESDSIDPDVRKRLAASLRALSTKRDRNPTRKHGNMPL